MHLGTILKERREQVNLTLTQVSHLTKIKAKYLQAIEEWNITEFPCEAYLKGFLKTYASLLSLNIEQSYIDELALNKTETVVLPEILMEDSRPTLLYLVVSVLSCIVIYNIWLITV